MIVRIAAFRRTAQTDTVSPSVAFDDEFPRSGHVVHTPDLFEGRTFATVEEGVGYAELEDARAGCGRSEGEGWSFHDYPGRDAQASAWVEALWFAWRLHGKDPLAPWNVVDWDADPDWAWHSAAEDTPAQLHAIWQAALIRSRSRLPSRTAACGTPV